MAGDLLVDRFRVRAQLGAGAFGTVFAAEDQKTGEVVALKRLTRVSGATVYRFKREFRAVADHRHPNLVRLHELFSDGEDWLFSMELVPGERFDAWVLGTRDLPDQPSTLPSATTGPEASARRGALDAAGLARLRPALAQLVTGVSRLHALGVVHRDLKPANVLVTREGRVVVLDFGLATEADADAQASHLGLVMGTPTYMAPEQALGQAATPATDWYAVGVMLFELLHGRPPFLGTPQDLHVQKLTQGPAPLPLLSGEAADLDRLCRALLAADPAARPDEAAIKAVLADAAPPATPGPRPRTPGLFVGRARERAALDEAFAAALSGRPVVVRVKGSSGVGKTTLVDAFVNGLGPDAVVLRGRCYERESVPYKGLDGVVDALTRYLRRLSPEELAVLVPREAPALCRLFPVVSRLPLLAEQPEWKRSSSPHEERRRGFAALRELLGRISDRRPLVVAIDDVQWSDQDSIEPLRSLLAPPNAPCMLLLLTSRAEDEARSPALRGLAEPPLLESPGDLRTLSLAPLSDDESLALARALLPSGERHRAEAIARESGGMPFYLPELARTPHAGTVSLERMLRARAEALSAPARRLLKVLSLAGRPLRRATATLAAGQGAEAEGAIQELVSETFALQSPGEGGSLETFHDRMREAVVAGLKPEEARTLHAALAEAIAAGPGGVDDAEALAEHYRLSGDLARARPAAIAAAERATTAFAFERAITLYQTARIDAPAGERRALTVRLAEALSYAGRNRQAGNEYLAAAEGAPPKEARQLRRLAAELYLRAGVVDEGLRLAHGLVAEAGIPWRTTRAGLVAAIVGQQALIKLRGYEFHERTPGPLDDEAVERVDLLWSLGVGLSPIDIFRSAEYQARHVRAALALGEPYRAARALAMEGLMLSVLGGSAREKGHQLARRSVELAARVDVPQAMGFAALSMAVAEWAAARWRSSTRSLEEGLEVMRRRDPQTFWQIAVTEIWFKVRNHYYLGDLEAFCADSERVTRTSEERGDLLTLLSARSTGLAYVHLVRDDPRAARETCTQGLAGLTRGNAWLVQHQESLRTQVCCDLYAGDGPTAMRRIADTWASLKRSLLLQAENERYLNYATYLAAAVSVRDLSAARRWQRELAKQTYPVSRAWAVVGEAGVRALQGDRSAAEAYERAAVALDALEMSLYAAAARRRRGELLGGAEGAALVDAADARFRAQGVRSPERFARQLIA